MISIPRSGALPVVGDSDSGGAQSAFDALAGLDGSDRAAREQILHRAYAIWEREGHPSDRSLAHWLEAENQLIRKTDAAPPRIP
jgi:hypothetical protein